MLEDYFRQILDEYEKEKTKAFKGNYLVFKIRKDLPKEFSKYLNNDVTVKAACGVSSWPESPWVSIIYNSFESSQQALILQYNFDTKKSEMSLSLILRLKEKSEYSQTREFLLEKATEYNLYDFTVNKNNTSNIILSKNYIYSQINEGQIRRDLNNILKTYKKLSDDLICEFKNDENSDTEVSEIKDIDADFKKENIYPKNITDLNELFRDENIDKIIKCQISPNQYRQIINKICQDSKSVLENITEKYNIDFNELQTKDKILLYSKSFTKTEYKSLGRILGSYSFNTIRIDDRLPNPLIITSIIHELTHFLLEKILKEVLMKILESNDTPLISSYVKIMLEDNDLNYLLDEFCAHTVEGRFALYGYQDYSSFKYKLNEISDLYSKEDIEYVLLIGNSFAYDIKDIMESFIDENLREDIKNEFLKLMDRPDYEPLDLEIDSKLEDEYFTEALALILTSGIGEVLNNPQKLERYMKKYYAI